MPGKTLITIALRDALVKYFEGKNGIQGDFYRMLKPKGNKRSNLKVYPKLKRSQEGLKVVETLEVEPHTEGGIDYGSHVVIMEFPKYEEDNPEEKSPDNGSAKNVSPDDASPS